MTEETTRARRPLVLLALAALVAATYFLIERRYAAERRLLVLHQDEIAQALALAELEDHGPLFEHEGALYAGRYRVNWSDALVDSVRADSDCGVDIFQGDERIATTLTNAGTSERAIGTRADPEIKQRVLVEGHEFRGPIEVFGKSILAVYRPLKDDESHIVGMLGTYRDVDSLGRELLYFRLMLGGTLSLLLAAIVLLVVRADRTARLASESRRRALEDRARQQLTFFESMAQELRTPLSASIVFSDSLRDSLKNDEQAHALVERLHSETKGVLSTVDDILDYSRLQAGSLVISAVDVDLKAILLRAKARAEQQIGARAVKVDLDVPEDLPQVVGDPARVEQVVRCLLTAAVQATPEGRIRCRAVAESATIAFEVTDRGPDLTESALEKVWDAFAEENRGRGGGGLQLPIARALVLRMGGHVTAKSKRGRGTTYTAHFARAQVTI